MSNRTSKNVGVIGLGIIGTRVAGALRKAGWNVFVWSRTPRPVQNFVGSRGEVAQLCDYIQIFVSNDEALLETINSLAATLTAKHIVLAHSTVAPETMGEAGQIVEERGARFLDAPFTGSKTAAEKGELVYYIGGDEATLQQARPVLEASSKGIVEIGAIGQATLVKLATNLITAATVQAGAEALALVTSAGLPPEKFLAAMDGNASSSQTLAMKFPKMVEGNYEPQFSLKHMLKDLGIAARIADSFGLDLPVTTAANDMLHDQLEEGRADEDYSAVGRKYFAETVPSDSADESMPDVETGEATPAVREAGDQSQEPSGDADLTSDSGIAVVEEIQPLPDASENELPAADVGKMTPTEKSAIERSDAVVVASATADQAPQENEPRRGLISKLFTADY
jgi:3-hydroxyisobutyrate dehydrogenase-like beta-hydroxyacid dehydrogenase